MRPRFLFLLLPLATMAAAAACGDDDTTTPATPAADGGGTGDTGPVVVGSNEAKQTGKIVRAQSTSETVEGATVTIAGKTATTNATGNYEIAVPKDTPVQMTVSAPDFYKLIEQEWIVKGDLDRGETQLLKTGTANLLAGVLNPPRDASKGLLVVSVRVQPPCASEEGTTLTLDPPGQANVSYVGASGLPDDTLTSVQKGAAFSAIFYNVDPGVNVRVIASSPSCEQVAFPLDADGVTLTGNQKTEPGESLSFLRIYLGPAKSVDAGGQ
jgi:hypothetical protein